MLTAKGRMRYLIVSMAATLIGCASATSRPSPASTVSPSFVDHWNKEDLSKDAGPITIDVRPDGTFSSVDKDADHTLGKWAATSKTSATLTDDDDKEVVPAELSGSDEMVVSPAGETPIRFKRQP